MSLTPGAREAARAYVHPLDATPLTATGSRRVEDFVAGYDAGYSAALSPPTPEEIEAAIQAHRGTHDHEMRTALLAFLEGRKR